MKNNYIIGSKNEAFGPGGIQNAINDTLVKTKGAVDAKLIEKNINNNGTYSASAEGADGFKKVVVDVPNTYFLSDEGKVVSNGNLVEQTEITVTENGTINTTFNNSVIVDVPSGPAPAQKVSKGAIFRDYDGTIVYSYTKEQVAELSELPIGPTHDGLTFQGWNWSLSNVKDYVNKYDFVEVGATYITNDGKTRIYITLPEGRLFPKLGLAVNGSVDIDWGDGSAHDTITGSSTNASDNQWKEHQYSQAGDYIIILDVTGVIGFNGTSGEPGYVLHKYDGDVSDVNHHIVYTSCITKIHLGSGVIINDYAFNACYGLSSITIPDGVTSIGNAFADCYGLSSITIPDGVTRISANAFNACNNLSSITIPDGVTVIGSRAFQQCYNLSSITIPVGVTSISTNVFNNCYGLSSITIPVGVTSIGGEVFYYCYNLSQITIPDGVTNIGNSAFAGCYGLGILKFESTTPPAVSRSNTFTDIPTDCIIMVPTGTLEAYTSAENYPDPTIYTYVEY